MKYYGILISIVIGINNGIVVNIEVSPIIIMVIGILIAIVIRRITSVVSELEIGHDN